MRRLLLLLLPLARPYSSVESHPYDYLVGTACDVCNEKLGHAIGGDFMSCVVDELLGYKRQSIANGTKEFFPIVPHNFDPWEPLERARGWAQSDLLKDLMRNYSCDVEDGGSQPIRHMTWEYQPEDPCGSLDDSAPPPPPYVYKAGFLPQGNDLPSLGSDAVLTEQEAQDKCDAHPSCAGFTYSGERHPKTRHQMHFKTDAASVNVADGWHTMKRRGKNIDCRPGKRKPPPPAMRLNVSVLRESPPVYIVHDFASDAECQYMMGETIPNMAPSVVYGGGSAGQASSYRQVCVRDAYHCAAAADPPLHPSFHSPLLLRLPSPLYSCSRSLSTCTPIGTTSRMSSHGWCGVSLPSRGRSQTTRS